MYVYGSRAFTIFIPVGGCVGRGPGALLCPGTNNAVKVALVRRGGGVSD